MSDCVSDGEFDWLAEEMRLRGRDLAETEYETCFHCGLGDMLDGWMEGFFEGMSDDEWREFQDLEKESPVENTRRIVHEVLRGPFADMVYERVEYNAVSAVDEEETEDAKKAVKYLFDHVPVEEAIHRICDETVEWRAWIKYVEGEAG